MCSLDVLNDSSQIQETTSTKKTNEKDQNYKQRKGHHQPDRTKYQSKSQNTNFDAETKNSNNSNNNNMGHNNRTTTVKSPRKVNLCTALWSAVFTGAMVYLLAALPEAAAAEHLHTVDRRDISSSLFSQDSENLVADSEKYYYDFYPNVLYRKKRDKSKSLTFLDYVESLGKRQSPSLHRKRRIRSVGGASVASTGNALYITTRKLSSYQNNIPPE